jgi:hypothetical protein
MVNDVIPIESAIEKLTTSIGVKIDRTRHRSEIMSDLKGVIQKHAGKKELFVQIQTADGTKVSLRVNGELGVRLTKDLVEDLEQLLGNGSVQLGGDGQKRMKRLAQQQLFKDAAAAQATTAESPVSDAIAEPELESELALEEV